MANFFEHQSKARRKTGLLVALYALAVGCIVLGIYFGAVAVISGGLSEEADPFLSPAFSWWHPEIFLVTAFFVGAAIGLGSLYKIYQLNEGGAAVARMLGGRLLTPDSSVLEERKILNVVEEMAIAAGISVPPVYLMDKEESINAFAAGFSVQDAVIGVSKGCIAYLSRDELQGVVAHEFSHIFHGDMRLNLRLIGVLHGILLIALMGRLVLRSTIYAPRRRSSGGKSGGGVAAAAAMGVLLLLLGSIGVFFGHLIKMAVSREREFLADASAVQYTRNPIGISGALKKIGALAEGSTIHHPRAAEASHMFFAAGLASKLGGFFATHPPLVARIRKIEPRFDGKFPPIRESAPAEKPSSASRKAADSVEARGPLGNIPLPLGKIPGGTAGILAMVGTLSAESINQAAGLLERIPNQLRSSVHEPLGAMASLYALLLDSSPSVRDGQRQRLRESVDEAVWREIGQAEVQIMQLDPLLRLPLAEIALGSLRWLSPPQYQQFRANIEMLVDFDQSVNIFEYALEKMIVHELDSQFSEGESKGLSGGLDPHKKPEKLQLIISVLAFHGAAEEQDILRAVQAGCEAVSLPLPKFDSTATPSLAEFDKALSYFVEAAPSAKEVVLKATAATIMADGVVKVAEAELLRAIGYTLNCPLPLGLFRGEEGGEI